METKKRPIAMRCTQEEFDSIKDRIKYEYMSNFDNSPYLCNYYYEENSIITNTAIPNSLAIKHEVHETFNGNIFLEACGVEVEKVWKHGEMQVRFKKGVWCDFSEDNNFEYRVKPQPSYIKEIEALQEKAKLNGMKAVITFEKL